MQDKIRAHWEMSSKRDIDIDGLVQDRSNSIAYALELPVLHQAIDMLSI